MLPKHTPSLKASDFMIYLGAPFRRRRNRTMLLEALWRELLPGRRLIGTPSGRHALWYFIEAMKLPRSSEVLIAAYNYYVVVRIVIQQGLKPVFVDIDSKTLSIDVADLRNKITPQTKLVVVTHMFGIPADLDSIAKVCNDHGLLLFEDCAHGVGTIAQGRQVGNVGDGALFSFGPQKILTCFGAGMLVMKPDCAPDYLPQLPSPANLRTWVSTFLKCLVTLGMSPATYGWILYPMTKFGRWLGDRGIPMMRDLVSPSRDNSEYRFRINGHTPFQAFMLPLSEQQLARLEANVTRRREIVERIKRSLGDRPELEFLDDDKFGRANGSYFGLYVPDSANFTKFLALRGIEVNPDEFRDCASLPQFSEFAALCPRARYAAEHLVRLPSYPTMSENDVQRIISTIHDYFATEYSPSTHVSG